MVLRHIHTNRLINCCSDMSTIVFSDQSSIFFYILQWADVKFKRTLKQKVAAIPRIIFNRCIVMANVEPAITPRAKDPDKMAKFVTTIKVALETFDDEISSLQQATRLKVYKNLVRTYRAALTEVWDFARFADVGLILDMVKDKEMQELVVMASRLKVPEQTMHTEVENRKVPTLEMITGAMVSTYPSQKLPNMAICIAIGDIFSKLSKAHKAYAEAADGLAQMSTKVSPEHYTLIVMAVTAPAIQLVLPPGMTSPATALQPPPHQATTLLGRAAIIDATKQKVLLDPNAPCLTKCNKNTATRVLAVAIYSKIERKYFDSMHSRMKVSTAFCCNVSQLTNALTGVEYHSGPHHYKPKPRESCKRTTDHGEPDAPPPKKTKAAPSKKTTMTFSLQKTDIISPDAEDTLESESSSDSTLPEVPFK